MKTEVDKLAVSSRRKRGGGGKLDATDSLAALPSYGESGGSKEARAPMKMRKKAHSGAAFRRHWKLCERRPHFPRMSVVVREG